MRTTRVQRRRLRKDHRDRHEAPNAHHPDSSSSAHGSYHRATVRQRKAAPLLEILKKLEQVYPVELPEPAGLAPSTRLYTYQKQSLAFMVDTELGRNGVACNLPHKLRIYPVIYPGKHLIYTLDHNQKIRKHTWRRSKQCFCNMSVWRYPR